MPRGSEELTNARKAEIVNACAVLYETRSFKEITLKEIGEKTSFTRTSIYNYFQTKEEIFLALFQREYEAWIEDLDALRCGHRKLSVDALIWRPTVGSKIWWRSRRRMAAPCWP